MATEDVCKQALAVIDEIGNCHCDACAGGIAFHQVRAALEQAAAELASARELGEAEREVIAAAIRRRAYDLTKPMIPGERHRLELREEKAVDALLALRAKQGGE